MDETPKPKVSIEDQEDHDGDSLGQFAGGVALLAVGVPLIGIAGVLRISYGFGSNPSHKLGWEIGLATAAALGLVLLVLGVRQILKSKANSMD